MAEKVEVTPLRRKGPPIRVHPGIAKVLVDRRTYAYADDADRSTYAIATDRQDARATKAEATTTKKAPKRRTKAAEPAAETEVEFVPSESLDVEPKAKKSKTTKKRTYKRRDMKAEE